MKEYRARTPWAARLLRGSALAFAGLLAVATTAYANNFATGTLQSPSGTNITNGDGVFFSLETVAPVQVQFSTGGNGTTLPQGAIETSNNSRDVEIDSFAADFVGMGYSAGLWSTTAGNQYSGLNANRGIQKRVFFFIDNCSTGGSACRIYFEYHDVIAASDVHTYQIQRNILAEGPRFRFWFDGRQLGGAYTSNIVNGTLEARVFHGGATAANMTQQFRRMSFHRYGSASSNPPGLTSYSPVLRTSASIGGGCSQSDRFSGSTYLGWDVAGTC